MILLSVLIEGGILFQIKPPEIEKARFIYIFSSNLFNIVIFISNRSSPVTVDRKQFREHILNVIRSEIIMNNIIIINNNDINNNNNNNNNNHIYYKYIL